MSYSAKDIQRVNGVDRDRYSFLARKIPILPDVEQAAGRGTVKRYSFAKVLEFAFADRLSRLGLSTKAIRETLDELRDLDHPLGLNLGFFDPHRRDLPGDERITIGFEQSRDGISPMVLMGDSPQWLARFDVAVVVNLGKIRKEIEGALAL
jgi:DNA-binding transcriptional MerR regulator